MRHPSNPSHTWLLVILGLLGAPLLAVQSAAGVSIQILEQHSDRLRVLYSVGPGVRLTSGNSGGTASAALLGSLVKTGVVGIPLTGEVELEIVEVSPGGTFDMPRNVRWDLPLVGPVSLGSTGFVRNQRVVQLNFSPRLVNGGPQVQLFNRVVADLYFTAARSDHKPHHLRGDGNPNRSWEERLYSKALINYEQARYWRQTGAAAKAVVQDATANDYLRLTVRQQGVHRITGQELADAGVPLSEIVPDAIRLRYGGGLAQAVSGSPALGVRLREIPIVVEDGEDGRFDNGDALLFYGEPAERWVFSSGNDGEYFWRQNPYAKDNVYFLEWTGDGNGLRGGVVSGALSVPDALATDNYRERLHVEEEKESVIELEGIKSGYDWFWETFRGNAADFTTTLRDVVTDDPVDVDVRFWGLSGGSHRFDLRWNFDVIGNVSFSGPQASTLSASSRRGALEGVNRLGVLHRDNTASRLDWYELEYTRQLHARDDGGVSFDWLSAAGLKNADVSSANSTTQFHLSGFNNGRPRIFEFRAPRTLKEVVDFEYEATTGSATFQGLHTGFGVPPLYVAIDAAGWKRPAAIERKSPARLKTSDNGADYVIITHRNFRAAAERLAAWRAEDDRFGTPLVTRVADVEDIYDEFSGGLLDPMAIRSFVNYAVDNWDPAPVFILLMGDGSYDYKNNLGLSDANWIPAFQDGASMYDEWYVRIEGGDELPDLAIGRLPVGSTKEAEAVVDKLISYDRNPEIGLWQARALLVADDIVNPATHQDESFFVRDAEQMASDFLPQDLAVSKLYFGRFPLQGRTKPSAREAFVRRFNEGALILTYIGHGNPETLTHEQIFVLTRDIDGIDNGGRLPLVYTAASQVGVFDDPSRQSIPEVFVNKPDGGAIGFISATRVGIHHSNMILAKEFHEIMYNSDDDRVAVGLALMAAKQRVTLSPGDRTNVQRYSLLGDPAQILNRPLLSVQIEAPDSLQAGQEVRFAGRVQDASGDAITDFSGQALVQAFDSSVRSVVEGNPWEQPGVPIFRSLARVEGGVFAGVFRVPRDISYRESEGSMSAYVWNEGTQTAFGSVRGIAIGGVEQGLTPGNNGPTVALAFDGAAGGGAFRDGDFVSSRPRLTALIEDEDGINITGAIGHEIELQIDGELFKVTDSYTSQNGGYKTGLLDYEIAELDPGSHQLRLKVWDNLNNSSQVEATIRVAEASVPSLTSVIFHPNPMQDQGHFTYTLATPAHAVSIKVFTLSGRLVDELKGGELPGYNQVSWEPPSALANGTYLYHIQATTEDGFGFEATSAVQVVR